MKGGLRTGSARLAALFAFVAAIAGCTVEQRERLMARAFEEDDESREILHASIGLQAYLYGVSQVETYKALWDQSLDRTSPRYTPFNRFRHHREFPRPDFLDVTVPNDDTPYSFAWLQLADGPMVVHVPAVPDRYYSLLFMDFYNDTLGYVGPRATGRQEGSFVVTGPGWDGTLPEGFPFHESHAQSSPEGIRVDRAHGPVVHGVLRATTPYVWIYGRTRALGEPDLPAMRAIGFDGQVGQQRAHFV